MEVTELLTKAGNLMLIGMVVVFTFLGSLVFLTRLMSYLVIRYQTQQTQAVQATPLPQAQGEEIAPQTVAAISAAIHQYRKSQK
ncbi:MAG: OadG family protein [Algicola sp.]|nr:OadG family protein [Algicola sp.]